MLARQLRTAACCCAVALCLYKIQNLLVDYKYGGAKKSQPGGRVSLHFQYVTIALDSSGLAASNALLTANIFLVGEHKLQLVGG